MRPQRNALKAGIFMVMTLVLILGIIAGIQGVASVFQPQQMRTVRFNLTDDIGGLRVGDEIRAGGFKIGEVKDIALIDAGTPAAVSSTSTASAPTTAPSATPGACIVITYTIPKQYIVRQDARLRIQSTLTGVSWLNFETFGNGAPLPVSQSLAGLPSAMNQMMAAAGDAAPSMQHILSDLQATVSDVRTKIVPAATDMIGRYSKTADTINAAGDNARLLTADLRGQVTPIVAKYQSVMDTLRDKGGTMLDRVSDFFGSTTPDFRATLANLSHITGDVKTRLPGMLDRFDGIMAHVDTSIQNASGTLDDIKVAAGNVKEISASARELIVGNRGKINTMIASLKATGDNLKNATAEIRRSPWRLLYKPAPNEMGNLNLFDAARAFSDGASELNDAAASLRDAMASQQLSKADLQKLMDRVDQSFTHFQGVEQKLWQQVKE